MILAAGAGAQVAFSALQTGLPALGPALRVTFDLSLPKLGLVLGATTLGTLATVYAWGVAADRLGERRVLAVGLVGTALALVWAARASSPAALVTALLVAGACGGCTSAASARAVMGWFGAGERAFALSVRQTAVPLGAGVAALLLPAIAGVAGVAGAFLVLAGLAAAGAVATGLLLRDPPAFEAGAAAGVRAPRPLRDRRLWRLAAGCSLVVAAQYGLAAFFPVFLHEQLDWSQAGAGAALALGLGLSALGRPAAGRWSDRVRRRVAPLRALALAGAMAAAFAALLASGPETAMVAILVAALVPLWSWNGLAFAAAGELSGAAQAGAALGLLTTVVFAAGALAPPVLGAIVDAGSWPAGFAAVSLAALGGWLVLGRLATGRRPGTPTEPQAATAGKGPAR